MHGFVKRREEKNMRHRYLLTVLAVAAASTMLARSSFGQGYGTDLQNVMAPASGGMAGVSTARPQDVPSAIFGNPATMAQFEGTQFTIGGGWLEGYPTVDHQADGAGAAFTATSRTEGFLTPEIGVTQDLRPVGLNGTFGLGLASESGLGAEYRGMVPQTPLINNSSSEYLVLGVNLGAGFQLNDRLALGAAITLGNAFEELGNVGPLASAAMVNAYGLRGTIGATYDLNECNTLGFYYQSKMHFTMIDGVRLGTDYFNVNIDQPDTFGIGLANRSLMGGNLLLACDVYYKLWQDADLWQDLMVNQWVFAVGAQYTSGCTKYRIGYSFNSDPINHSVGAQLDGFPVGQDALQLYQAANLPLVNQHRITAGIGRQDVLFRGLDVDLYAGGMLPQSGQFGPSNTSSLGIYYLGLGLTWRYLPSTHE
jgi:long-chain fatty acid transport protein